MKKQILLIAFLLLFLGIVARAQDPPKSQDQLLIQFYSGRVQSCEAQAELQATTIRDLQKQVKELQEKAKPAGAPATVVPEK